MSNYNTYFKKDQDKLKYKFNNYQSIERNYSQAFQDLFVLSILNGKKNGTYVEIGGDHPINISNSYLLETEFDWVGVSLEIDSNKVEYYNSIRKNKCISVDATKADYSKLFSDHNFSSQIDYLQVDIEPSWQTLKALKKIPLNQYRFSVITFETDLYKDGDESAEECHNILTEFGYKLVIKNVANEGCPYENWYVDPIVVDSNIVNIFENISDSPKEAINCLLS
jgi:hypothetical protein